MTLAAQMGMEVPPQHLIQSEINSVTSAIRKHVRNASSSSFLGGSSNAAGMGPVAGGSSTASLLRSAVFSASAHHSLPNGAPSALSSGGAATLRVAHGGKMKEEFGGEAMPTSTRVGGQRYGGYPDGRRDEGVASLLNSFTILRAQLRETPNIDTFPLNLLLSPFLRVILSPRTTGPITSIALQAVHRLLIYHIVKLPGRQADEGEASATPLTDVNAVQLAVAEIAHAVSHCRFEASEAVADELVLLRILAVMRELICEDGRAETLSIQGLDSAALRGLDWTASRQSTLSDCLCYESIC